MVSFYFANEQFYLLPNSVVALSLSQHLSFLLSLFFIPFLNFLSAFFGLPPCQSIVCLLICRSFCLCVYFCRPLSICSAVSLCCVDLFLRLSVCNVCMSAFLVFESFFLSILILLSVHLVFISLLLSHGYFPLSLIPSCISRRTQSVPLTCLSVCAHCTNFFLTDCAYCIEILGDKWNKIPLIKSSLFCHGFYILLDTNGILFSSPSFSNLLPPHLDETMAYDCT